MKVIFTYCIIAISILFLPKIISAQISRGNVLIGADISNLNYGLTDNHPFTMLINPKAAVFFNDNVAIGAYMRFGLFTSDNNSGTSITYGIGPLTRYYFNKRPSVLGHTCFYMEGNVGIEGNNPASGDNTNGLGLGVGPGLAYFFSPNVSLEGMIKYNGIVGFGEATTSGDLHLSFGLQIFLSGSRAPGVK